jgi:hypothetical protein
MSFVPHTAELLKSAALRSLSRPAMLILFRLELEHCQHAGKENGYLIVTYDQFVKFGVSRRFIRPGLTELEQVGLVAITHKGKYGKGGGDASHYRLTYLVSKFIPATGAPYYLEPTNEWRAYVPAKMQRRKRYDQKSVFSVHTGELVRFRRVN